MTPRMAFLLFVAGPALGILTQAIMGPFRPRLVIAAALVGEAAAWVVAWGLGRAAGAGAPGSSFLASNSYGIPLANRLFGLSLLAALALAVAGLALLAHRMLGRTAP